MRFITTHLAILLILSVVGWGNVDAQRRRNRWRNEENNINGISGLNDGTNIDELTDEELRFLALWQKFQNLKGQGTSTTTAPTTTTPTTTTPTPTTPIPTTPTTTTPTPVEPPGPPPEEPTEEPIEEPPPPPPPPAASRAEAGSCNGHRGGANMKRRDFDDDDDDDNDDDDGDDDDEADDSYDDDEEAQFLTHRQRQRYDDSDFYSSPNRRRELQRRRLAAFSRDHERSYFDDRPFYRRRGRSMTAPLKETSKEVTVIKKSLLNQNIEQKERQPRKNPPPAKRKNLRKKFKRIEEIKT